MEPLVSLVLTDPHRIYQPGDSLQYEFQLDAVAREDIVAVETSVLWYSEGKGDQDMGVHFFERRVPSDAEENDLRLLRRFKTPVPNSPLSYDGLIVKLRWCVRVRVFLRRGREFSFEQPFTLGNVPPAKPPRDKHDDEPTDKPAAGPSAGDAPATDGKPADDHAADDDA